MLKFSNPLSSPDTLSTRENWGALEGSQGDRTTALGFGLFLVHEGNRLLERGEWLLQFLISKKCVFLSLSHLGSSGKRPWNMVMRGKHLSITQKHKRLSRG